MKIELLRMDNIVKSFDGILVLNNTNFTLHKGEVHALIGENGAGKSSLMNILTGAYQKDKGTIFFKEQKVEIKSLEDSKKIGISYVGQNMQLVKSLTVAENIFLLNGTKRGLLLDKKEMNEKTQKLLNMVGMDNVRPEMSISSLSTSQKRLLEFARAISADSPIIILDEITISMTFPEYLNIVRIINELKAKSVSFIYISHKLDEIMRIADRVTVLRDGITVLTLRRQDCSKSYLTSLMLGNIETNRPKIEKNLNGDEILNVKHLSTEKLTNISFSLHKGEIVAISGEGKEELAKSFFGLVQKIQGEFWSRGQKISLSSPDQAVRHGISYLPANRLKQGLILDFPIDRNITLSILPKISRFSIIIKRLERFVTNLFMKEFSIQESAQKKVRYLAGGNQQKVLLSRAIGTKPKILILINPTQGVDIATRYEIYNKLAKLAREGTAIIMCSTEIEEVHTCADRLLVLENGCLKKDLAMEDLTLENLIELEEWGDLGCINT